MDENLKSIILAYGILNAISFGFSVALFADNPKTNLFKLNCYYWASMVLLFGAQGLLGNSDFGIIFSFCFTPLYVVILTKVICELFNISLPLRNYTLLMGAGTVLSVLGSTMDISFLVASAPIALSSGGVLAHTAFNSFAKLKNQSISITGKLLLLVILLCAVHVLDFPFLRKNEQFVMSGFYIAFLLAIFMSVLLPYAIAEKTQKNYAANLKEEVRIKTKKLSDLYAELKDIAAERQNLIHLICHDLNNHLMVQLNFQSYLEKLHKNNTIPFKDDNFEKNLNKSRQVLEMQQSLTSKVHFMSSLENGKININLEPVSLLRSVSDSLSFLEEKILEKEINIQFKCEEDFNILADKALIVNSVINNIILNAIKFSQRNGTIHLRCLRKNDEVWLLVKDHGVGIPQSQLNDIFSRTKNSSRRGTEGERGTGFGMPIVYSIVKKFSGDIKVRSRETGNSGTLVCVIFRNAHEIETQKIA